ncbi:hypothetical protein F5Y10DRAFT_15122 [Nemania abortiva]|nr:hypothetical protein F5Y10DRAFT_15122 [Nemania abortiva]
MAPMAPTPAFSDARLMDSNGEAATPVNQAIPRSRSWRSKLQQHVNSWKQQNGAEKLAGNTSSSTLSPDHAPLNSTPRSARGFSRPSHGRSNAKTAPNQIPSIQSASLDSLTSASLFSRNSFPSITTDATSVSDALTTCGITCSIDSPSIKPYKQIKNNLVVYLAGDDIETPLDVVEQWETADLDRLKTDLSEVVMKIYRKGVKRESRRARSVCPPLGPHEYDVSFEIRMSGRAMSDARFVALIPSIWVICGSTWACKEIRAAMDEITWPTLPVEIHEGRVPIPSVAEGQIDISKLDLSDGYHLGDGITLFVHIEELPTNTTSCGLLCCATIKDGDNYSHHFSRIGGLVTTTNTLTSSQFGVSTAHGMLDHHWWHRQLWKRSSARAWDSQSIESVDSEDEDGFDSDSQYDDQESLYADLPNNSTSLNDDVLEEGYRDPRLVARWRNAGNQGVLSFLGVSIQKEGSLQDQVRLHDNAEIQTDHAMISLGWPRDSNSRPWNNKYYPRSTLQKQSIDITTHINNSRLTEGGVSIICQADSPIDGHLLPGSTCLAMGGRMFTLRKLRTEAPLARGVSGSWVARGTELCGMIIAVSNLEPYIYIMRAEDLISNLETSSPSIETVEIFSSHGGKEIYRGRGTLPRRWSSSRSHRRSVADVISPRVSIDEHRSMTSIKRSLSERLSKSIGGSRLHDAIVQEAKGITPRRKRSVRGLLSDMFRNKVEEIARRSDTKGVDIKQMQEVRRPNAASNRTHGYRSMQAKRRALPGTKRRPKMSLEPISEVSSFVGYEDVPERESVLLRSTAYSLTTTFRHGNIRMRKSDLIPTTMPHVNVNQGPPECPEYNIALDRTAHHWLSGNYEAQQEEDVDEVGDLVEWWESWHIDLGSMITEQDENPISPISIMSDDFPGVSHSDTNSEGSYPSWSSRPTSATEESFPEYSDKYGFGDIKGAFEIPATTGFPHNSEAETTIIASGQIIYRGLLSEMYGGHHVPDIMV